MNKKGKIATIVALTLIALVVIGLVVAAPRWKRGPAACKDGSDNDGDGLTDWPNDPGCSSKRDRTETNPNVECDDGTDNDGDGATDLSDGCCTSGTDNDESNCGDGVCEGSETQGNCPADCGFPDSCADTDGGNVITTFGMTYGYLNNNAYNSSDYCVDTSNVMEYYCSGAYEQSSQQSCGTDGYGANYCSSGDVYKDYFDYSCASGACGNTQTPELVEECDYGCTSGECDPIPDSCSDTDGGWYTETFGTVSGYLNEQQYSIDEYCVDSTTVQEYYCNGDYALGFPVSCIGNFTSSCSSGACV